MRVLWLIMVLLLLPFWGSTRDNDIKSIQWAINDAPPFHIIDGPYQGLGICDVLIDAVHRALPDVRRNVWLMPQPRISAALEDGIGLCFPCMIYKGTHDKVAFYSMPTHMYQPHHVITTAEKASMLSQKFGEPLPFAKLIADDAYRFGYPAGRRYSVLQPLIEQFPPFLARPGSGGAMAILQMIKADRLDYTLDYPVVANYFQQSGKGHLITLPLQENADQHVAGAVGCARTSWGTAVLHKINSVMPQVRQDPAFIQVLTLWAGADAVNYLKFNQQLLAQPEYNQSELPAIKSEYVTK